MRFTSGARPRTPPAYRSKTCARPSTRANKQERSGSLFGQTVTASLPGAGGFGPSLGDTWRWTRVGWNSRTVPTGNPLLPHRLLGRISASMSPTRLDSSYTRSHRAERSASISKRSGRQSLKSAFLSPSFHLGKLPRYVPYRWMRRQKRSSPAGPGRRPTSRPRERA